MKILSILLALVGLSSVAYNQQISTRQDPLQVGDKVPDLEFNDMLNSACTSTRLSEYNGKLVILDFWASWCSACRANLPKMNALSKKHPDILQIILVNAKSTGDSREKTMNVLQKIKLSEGQAFLLPTVAEDTILSAYFSHKIIPHYVWILDGKVYAMTSSEQLTSNNVIAAYGRQPSKMVAKSDIMDYDRTKPLFTDGNGGMGNQYISRSILSGHINGLPASINKVSDSSGHLTRVTITNSSILGLYQWAYGYYGPHSGVWLEVIDKNKVFNFDDDWGNWKLDNTYCYETSAPPGKTENIWLHMRDDLAYYFGYRASFETRVLKCLVLKTYDSTRIPWTKKAMAANNLGESNSKGVIDCQPVSVLVDYLNTNLFTPVLDESGCTLPVDMEFPNGVENIGSLKLDLKRYGFLLEELEREVSVFVLREK